MGAAGPRGLQAALAQYNLGICCEPGAGAFESGAEAVELYLLVVNRGGAGAVESIPELGLPVTGTFTVLVESVAAEGATAASGDIETLITRLTPEEHSGGGTITLDGNSGTAEGAPKTGLDRTCRQIPARSRLPQRRGAQQHATPVGHASGLAGSALPPTVHVARAARKQQR